MELIRGLQNLKLANGGCVVSIGNYDGFHLGHQELIRTLKIHACIHELPSIVITFEPYPQEYFCQNDPPPRLMSFREKLELFRQNGVDTVFCLRFNSELAGTSARQFIQHYLVDGLQVRHIVVGNDFRFGKDRAGSVELLSEMAGKNDFKVTGVGTIQVDGERVSSSRIRKCLERGDLEKVQELAGRRFSISGRVVPGDKRGRTLGFPTANIFPRYDNVPLRGVFAVIVTGIGSRVLQGVANLGNRPTVTGDNLLLEVHFLSFDQDIYGQRIQVEFCHRIRSERKFKNLEALQTQIHEDVVYAKKCFQIQGD